MRVALGVTGGIAAYKSIEILRGLQRNGCDVRVAMTRHACKFIQPLTFRALSGSYVVIDDYSPDNPDPIAHITFSQTIDLFIIAPATANTLAKMANGIADDFISTTYLACTAPVIVAPAMNTVMWRHPSTQRNVERLREAGVLIIDPDEGEMACGTIGPGRLSNPEIIITRALEVLGKAGFRSDQADTQSAIRDLSGETILITAGATREAIDPVRFISNRSSGRMGFALADAAKKRGASVTIVAGHTQFHSNEDHNVIQVGTAAEMLAVVNKHIGSTTVFIAAAAVADYKPKNIQKTKIKKSGAGMLLELERTNDILEEVSRARIPGQLVVGFAAETNDLLANARSKLEKKQLDLMIANDVARNDSGFDSENNEVSILRRDSDSVVKVPLTSKLDVAHRILDEVVNLRHVRRATA
jgi:phosphopantothenoylcysteine decarboxylase/phosphopantothenate--cysteine ligase